MADPDVKLEAVEEEVEEEVEVLAISDDECLESKIIRGPNKKGRDTYAPYVEYGNCVALDHMQEAYVKAFCAKNKPKKPLYICTLQKSHVIRGKMYFTKSYTQKYLRRNLSENAVEVRVSHHKTEKSLAKIKLGKAKHDKRAMMTTQWMSIVNKWGDRFKKGDIILIWFRRCLQNPTGLKVIVKKLQKCGGDC
ncbi:unnamed protein product [Alopecurus aequalis]